MKLTHGSGQFVAVIVDHTHERVLEVLKNRSKETVRDYLQQNRDSGLLAEVIEVTTDMWDGYVEAVREALGEQVRITIDRFHVMKNFQDHLTAVRREIQRQLPQEEAKALKGTRWLWLTNQGNLSVDERAELAGWGNGFRCSNNCGNSGTSCVRRSMTRRSTRQRQGLGNCERGCRRPGNWA